MQVNNTKNIVVHCRFYPTLVDGKISNILNDNKWSQACPCCHATPNDFNEVKYLSEDSDKFKPKESSLIYGIQQTHAFINTFNCLLNVSVRLDSKEWQGKGAAKKQKMLANKADVLNNLWETFHIQFAQPRSGGSGSTTTGNLCRRAFSKPKKLANALKLDEQLVTNLSIILATINIHEDIDIKKFGNFCTEAYKLFLHHYGWYKLPASLHKLLAHAEIIMNTLPIAAGYFSEEGSEAHNKIYRKDRTTCSKDVKSRKPQRCF